MTLIEARLIQQLTKKSKKAFRGVRTFQTTVSHKPTSSRRPTHISPSVRPSIYLSICRPSDDELPNHCLTGRRHGTGVIIERKSDQVTASGKEVTDMNEKIRKLDSSSCSSGIIEVVTYFSAYPPGYDYVSTTGDRVGRTSSVSSGYRSSLLE